MSSTLESNGLVVARGLVPNQILSDSLKAITEAFNQRAALPGPLSAAAPTRVFLPVQTSPNAPMNDTPTHKRDFKLPFETIEPLLKSALGRAASEYELLRYLPDPDVMEITVIRGLPGADAQEWHADSSWSSSSPKMITMFLALHDVVEESMGPTWFVSNTHRPACFDDDVWIPPTPSLVEERGPVWFELNGGDGVLMESTCWHRGGANSGTSTRMLLAVTLAQGTGSSGKLRVLNLIPDQQG
mmetsp:Transcript_5030/g.9633  ORF Transcript_5030/g.9633 Transcript_5030/m.9633 type:complete len:243 (+) Transcript_5030:65-793(+)